jgi:cadmium resistance protein CadD (predicted permease)
LPPQTYHVSVVALANGGDNIGIYVPLFASLSFLGLSLVLAMFGTMLGVWCYTAYWLTKHPKFAPLVTRYGNTLVPFVLISLGMFILWENQSIQLLHQH